MAHRLGSGVRRARTHIVHGPAPDREAGADPTPTRGNAVIQKWLRAAVGLLALWSSGIFGGAAAADSGFGRCYMDQQNQYICPPEPTTTTAPRRSTTTGRHRAVTTTTTPRAAQPRSVGTAPTTSAPAATAPQVAPTTTSTTAEVTTPTSSPPSSLVGLRRSRRPSRRHGSAPMRLALAGAGVGLGLWFLRRLRVTRRRRHADEATLNR